MKSPAINRLLSPLGILFLLAWLTVGACQDENGDDPGDGASGSANGDGDSGKNPGDGDGDGDQGDPEGPMGGAGPIEDIPDALPTCDGEKFCANIRARRTDGIAPLAVFVEGTVDDQRDGDNFYHALDYAWDFHARPPKGEEGEEDFEPYTEVWETTGLAKGTATGPIASHVYDKPGVYWIELKVSDGDKVVSEMLEITVLSPKTLEHTFCFADIENNGGDFKGCPLDDDGDGQCSAPGCVDTNVFPEVASVEPSTRLLLRRGDAFTIPSGSARKYWQSGPGLITGFGSDAKKPVIAFADTSGIGKFGFSAEATDWRVAEVSLRGQSPFVDGNEVLFYNVDVAGGQGCLTVAPGEVLAKGVYWVGGVCSDVRTTGGWKFYAFFEQSVIQGLTLKDGRKGEGHIRFMHADKVLVQHNDLDYYPEKKTAISLRSCESQANLVLNSCPRGLPTQQLIVSDNRIIADQGAAVNFATGGPYKDVIVERNYSRFLGLPDGASIFGVKIETEETYGVTVRNNIEFTDSGNGFRFVYGSALGDVWAYGNTIVTSSGPSSATTLGCNGTFAGGFCSNNVLWAYVGDAEVNRSDIPGAGNFGPDDLGSISPFFKMLDVLTPPAVADFELDASSPAANGAVELEHFNRVDFLMRERLPEGASGALEMIPIGG